MSVSIDAVICKFDYRDSIKDPLGQLSAGSVNNHQELKQKWAHATANDDEGELWITIPEGMIQQASVRQHVDEVAARIISPKEFWRRKANISVISLDGHGLPQSAVKYNQ